MREIKFRGKEINTGEWVFGFYTQGSFINPSTEKETVRHIIDNGMLHDVVPETIGQYTGLKDKCNVGIYEGDIVEVYDFTSVYASKYQGVVKMCHGSWCVEHEDSIFDTVFYPSLFFDDFADRKTEITGNIHDNPELI